MSERWIAVAGDVHGKLDDLAALLERFRAATGHALDLLLQVGDLEPHRDERDVETLVKPARFRSLGDFPRYASGERSLPCEVVFIGGNHEPWPFLDATPSPCEISPGFTFLGRAGKVERLGLGIGGLSGVFSEKTRSWPRERARTGRGATCFVDEEVSSLMKKSKVDVLLLHDWPEGILDQKDRGKLPTLLRGSRVGNPSARLLVERLAPSWVFCGHLHVSHRNDLALEDGRVTRIRCLGAVNGEDPAAVIFLKWDGKTLEETAPLDELEALSLSGHDRRNAGKAPKSRKKRGVSGEREEART